MSRHRKRENDGLLRDSLTDGEMLGLVMDGVLAGSKPIKKLTKRVLKAQRRPHRAVDPDAWRIYLRLEELVNERDSMQAELLVKWAFTAGARSR
jgi:hypothetical protein